MLTAPYIDAPARAVLTLPPGTVTGVSTSLSRVLRLNNPIFPTWTVPTHRDTRRASISLFDAPDSSFWLVATWHASLPEPPTPSLWEGLEPRQAIHHLGECRFEVWPYAAADRNPLKAAMIRFTLNHALLSRSHAAQLAPWLHSSVFIPRRFPHASLRERPDLHLVQTWVPLWSPPCQPPPPPSTPR